MAFLAPLIPFLIGGAAIGGVAYGASQLIKKQFTPPKAPPPPASISPTSGIAATLATRSESIQAARPTSRAGARLALSSGGDSGFALDPLGRQGSGGSGNRTLLGR